MSRHILDGYDPTSDSWLADLNEMPEPNVDLTEAEAFIATVLYNIRRRDHDPKRCARKLWTIGAFTLVTFIQALAILIAQNFRCAVTANELTFTHDQLNTMRCADCFALTVQPFFLLLLFFFNTFLQLGRH
jgi:hypothetical protein